MDERMKRMYEWRSTSSAQMGGQDSQERQWWGMALQDDSYDAMQRKETYGIPLMNQSDRFLGVIEGKCSFCPKYDCVHDWWECSKQPLPSLEKNTHKRMNGALSCQNF